MPNKKLTPEEVRAATYEFLKNLMVQHGERLAKMEKAEEMDQPIQQPSMAMSEPCMMCKSTEAKHNCLSKPMAKYEAFISNSNSSDPKKRIVEKDVAGKTPSDYDMKAPKSDKEKGSPLKKTAIPGSKPVAKPSMPNFKPHTSVGAVNSQLSGMTSVAHNPASGTAAPAAAPAKPNPATQGPAPGINPKPNVGTPDLQASNKPNKPGAR